MVLKYPFALHILLVLGAGTFYCGGVPLQMRYEEIEVSHQELSYLEAKNKQQEKVSTLASGTFGFECFHNREYEIVLVNKSHLGVAPLPGAEEGYRRNRLKKLCVVHFKEMKATDSGEHNEGGIACMPVLSPSHNADSSILVNSPLCTFYYDEDKWKSETLSDGNISMKKSATAEHYDTKWKVEDDKKFVLNLENIRRDKHNHNSPSFTSSKPSGVTVPVTLKYKAAELSNPKQNKAFFSKSRESLWHSTGSVATPKTKELRLDCLDSPPSENIETPNFQLRCLKQNCRELHFSKTPANFDIVFAYVVKKKGWSGGYKFILGDTEMVAESVQKAKKAAETPLCTLSVKQHEFKVQFHTPLIRRKYAMIRSTSGNKKMKTKTSSLTLSKGNGFVIYL